MCVVLWYSIQVLLSEFQLDDLLTACKQCKHVEWNYRHYNIVYLYFTTLYYYIPTFFFI